MLNNAFHWAASFGSAVLLSMALAGVSHAEPLASAQDDPGRFARGAKAWANNCASCHITSGPQVISAMTSGVLWWHTCGCGLT